jgi:hypothetical protein
MHSNEASVPSYTYKDTVVLHPEARLPMRVFVCGAAECSLPREVVCSTPLHMSMLLESDPNFGVLRSHAWGWAWTDRVYIPGPRIEGTQLCGLGVSSNNCDFSGLQLLWITSRACGVSIQPCAGICTVAPENNVLCLGVHLPRAALV